jgi:hypothetical protein
MSWGSNMWVWGVLNLELVLHAESLEGSFSFNRTVLLLSEAIELCDWSRLDFFFRTIVFLTLKPLYRPEGNIVLVRFLWVSFESTEFSPSLFESRLLPVTVFFLVILGADRSRLDATSINSSFIAPTFAANSFKVVSTYFNPSDSACCLSVEDFTRGRISFLIP